MKISLYTAVKDGIANDLHFEAMLRHHLPLADEIVVNEGYSSDDSYPRLVKLQRQHPKIRVFRSHWETPKSLGWSIGFDDAARRAATGDWCIHLDCDEFIPDWEFDAIRLHLERTEEVLVPVRFINFYGNYKVYHAKPEKVHWPDRKMIIHRNRPDIEFWGDGANVRVRGQEFSWDTSEQMFTVHHFGMVRDAAALRQKWWAQGRAIRGRSTRFRPPRLVFRIFPHDWKDPMYFDDLAIYEGEDILAVRDEPKEFTRDRMMLVTALRAR
jgi:glycosyltransferase involved in cell wall biosynthesis